MSNMADRRAELERKREKLARLREEKERRRREKEAVKLGETPKSFQRYTKDRLTDTDEFLASLEITTAVSLPPTPIDGDGASISSIKHSSLPMSPANIQPLRPPPKKPLLSIVSVQQTNIVPQEKVIYDKQTQTIPSCVDREAVSVDYYDTKEKGGPFIFSSLNFSLEWEDEFQVLTYDDSSVSEDGDGSSLPSIEVPSAYPHHHPSKLTGLPNVKMVKPAQTPDQSAVAKSTQAEKPKIHDLSEDEKLLIMRSETFRTFLNRTSRIIERALYEEMDFFVDYTGTKEEQESDDRSGMTLSLNRFFYDDYWSKNRTVTCFDWSTQFPELLCASYNQNEDSPHDPDGICLIWNMKFKKTTPEYVFHCQSPVTSACFAKYHPNLVIGGTYSGQIVLWDNRSNKKTPVQRSPLSAVAHTHPVYAISMIGSANAHNLITVSTDGKCCSWSVDMLSQPQDTIELNQHKQSRTVAVTCMSFPTDEFNNFVVGTEDGVVYTACRHGSKVGILETFESHQGPVTGIDTHKTQSQSDFFDLFLTSSFDWTVKLWSTKSTQPLYSFEHNSDYVFDVRWSPIHPALFTCIDGLGHLDLWNLNYDAELPTAGTVIEGCPALNKVIWTPSGHHVTVGDSNGKIWLYDIGEQLANPKTDEWSRFNETLQDLQRNQSYQNTDVFNPSAQQVQFAGMSPMR